MLYIKEKNRAYTKILFNIIVYLTNIGTIRFRKEYKLIYTFDLKYLFIYSNRLNLNIQQQQKPPLTISLARIKKHGFYNQTTSSLNYTSFVIKLNKVYATPVLAKASPYFYSFNVFRIQGYIEQAIFKVFGV